MLGNELRKKCTFDPKLKWSVLFKRFIDNGFCIFEGTTYVVACWIEEWNLLRESMKIDKCTFGRRVEYMDLDIYKGSRFFSCGKFDIQLHQKQQYKFLYYNIMGMLNIRSTTMWLVNSQGTSGLILKCISNLKIVVCIFHVQASIQDVL